MLAVDFVQRYVGRAAWYKGELSVNWLNRELSVRPRSHRYRRTESSLHISATPKAHDRLNPPF